MSPPFVLYARTSEAFEDNLWLRIYDPNDKPRLELKFDTPTIKFTDEKDANDPTFPIQVQLTLPLQLKLDKEGTYWFDIAYRDFSLGGTGLVVRFRRLEEGKDATDTTDSNV